MSKVRWADMTDDDMEFPEPTSISRHGVRIKSPPPPPPPRSKNYVPPHLRSADKTKKPVNSNDE